MGTGATLAIMLIASASAPAAPPHLAEIKLFASTVAVARTAHETCSGTTINEVYLEGLRQTLHVVEADYPTYVLEARAAASTLNTALSNAPTKALWCDAAIRLYGPSGTLIRDLLRRKAPPP